MYSYSVHAGISHGNQLAKLRPELMAKIRSELDAIAHHHGGRPIEEELYHFPPSLGETARKAAEAAWAMHSHLMDHGRDLFGSTVLVTGWERDSGSVNASRMEPLLLKVPDEDGLWVSPTALSDFSPYFSGEEMEGLFRAQSMREAGPRLEERLPRLLVRPDCLDETTKALEQLELVKEGSAALVLSGRAGAGKRATLKRAFETLYPDDSGLPLVIPFADDSEDPMEPFVRALGPSLDAVAECLDEQEAIWWEAEGRPFLERCRQGQFRTASRDQGAVDLLQAFALYVKAHAEHRRRLGRPAYIVADAVAETSESLGWFQSLMTEFLEKECLRLVVIQDGDGVDFDLPFPKDSLEFPIPEPEDWKQIVDEASVGTPPSPLDLRDLQESCGASLYRLFHGLLAWERGEPVRFGSPDPGESLVESLDEGTRITLFLAHAASGLADRSFICERNGEDEEARYQEEARYDGLLALGLIREDPDGRVRLLPGGPTAAFALDDQKALAAQEFGAYLFQRYALGAPVDLFRLFRYLEQWGPHQQAIAALDLLVEGLLDNRRLRAAGILLNGPPMATADLGSGETEALQNVVGAARLRYVLLTGDAEGARNLVREGTLSLISGRGDYSDRFRLNHARFSYATGRWDDALAASKEALFAFQKSGNHEGETHSHLELALSLLAGGKVRDAMEHFSISRRIGTQVSASWGVLRASAMEVVSHFLFGNIPRAQRECQEYRNVARREGRRDLWLLLTLLSVRISWELGRYGEAASYAEEGRQTANFYGLSSEERVMRLWRARSLMTQGYAEGRRQLLSETETDALREARAFLSEAAWLGGNVDEAAEHIALAAGAERKSVRLQGEADDWSDGFFPLEGRLADSGGSLDVLDERIRAFSVFLGHDEASYEQLDHLLERDGRRIPRPYSYQYAIWASRLAEDDELSTRYVSRSFNDLQIRASRFDDNQTKHRWLSMNPWNKFIMEDAQKRKFL